MPLFTRDENTRIYILVGVPNSNTPMVLATGSGSIVYFNVRSHAQHVANLLSKADGSRYNVMPYTIEAGHQRGWTFEETATKTHFRSYK